MAGAGIIGWAWRLAREGLVNLYACVGAAFGDLVMPWFYALHPMDRAKRLLVLALSAWTLWGFACFWRRHPSARPYLLAFLLSWAPIFFQASRGLTRYLLPSLPLLLACLVAPLRDLAPLGARRAGIAALGLLALVLVNQALASAVYPRIDATERASYHEVHAFINAADRKPDLILTVNHFYTHLETGLPALWYPRQWPYAKSHGLAQGKKVWAVLSLPSPEAAHAVDLGDGWRLGAAPLTASGDMYLFEVTPP
jgi:hypothetical protein